MARLLELCLATIALMVASTFAVPLPCGGGNTGIVPPHCVTTCVHPNGCGEPVIPQIPHRPVIIDHDSDLYEHIHEHDHDHDHFDFEDRFDDDRFEFDDEDIFDDDEFDDDDCEEGEDFLDGGDFDNEDTDFGEDNDCHNSIHGCRQF